MDHAPPSPTTYRMIRQVVSLVISIAAGVGGVAALTREVGPVPSWLGLIVGALITLASIAQLQIRITTGRIDGAEEDPPVRGGRHRRG